MKYQQRVRRCGTIQPPVPPSAKSSSPSRTPTQEPHPPTHAQSSVSTIAGDSAMMDVKALPSSSPSSPCDLVVDHEEYQKVSNFF